MGQVWKRSCLARPFQVAQTTQALHWIMKTLRDGGLGSEEGAPTLGEWGLCSFESGVCGEDRRPAGALAGPGGRLPHKCQALSSPPT